MFLSGALGSRYDDPRRFVLVPVTDDADTIDRCLLFELESFSYILIEDDAAAAAIKARLHAAGTVAVDRQAFYAYGKPIDEWVERAIFARVKKAEIAAYLRSLRHPFYPDPDPPVAPAPS